MNTQKSFNGVRALTVAEVDEVSGGGKNTGNALVEIFLKAVEKGFEDAQKRAAAERLELVRNMGGLGVAPYGF